MTNITVSISEDLYRRMKEHPEVKWSEVVRRAIKEYLEKMKTTEVRDTATLLPIVKETGVALEKIPVEAAVQHFERMRELEWKRISTTQAS